MSKDKNIADLNRLLGDSCGLNKYGEPKYQWMRAGEMKFATRVGTKMVEVNGIYRPEPEMALQPQLPMCDQRQWVLAMWMPPASPSQWFAMHSHAPHLEARYTRIGRVVSGQDVINVLVVGDRILRASVAVR